MWIIDCSVVSRHMFSISDVLVFLVGIHRHKAGFYPTWTLLDGLNVSEFQRSVCYYKGWQNKSQASSYCFELWWLGLLIGYFHSCFLSLHCFTLLSCQTALPDGDPVVLERHPHWFASSFIPVSLHSQFTRSLFCIWLFPLCLTSTFSSL